MDNEDGPQHHLYTFDLLQFDLLPFDLLPFDLLPFHLLPFHLEAKKLFCLLLKKI